MAATKTNSTMLSAVTTTQTSSPVSTSTHYLDTLYISIVVVGTPTVAASIQVYESPDASAYYSPIAKLFTTNLVAGTYQWECPIDPATESVKVTFTAQTGGTSSTCTVQIGSLTGI